MHKNKLLKQTVSHITPVQAPPSEIFPLLCPVREFDWISDWNCEMVHSESGLNELHCVFTTFFEPVGKETWITVRHDPNERIEFVRCGDNWLIHYVITLTPAGTRTDITWTMHMIALTLTGNDHIRGMTNGLFERIMDALCKSLSYYFAHGECLNLSTREGA